MTVSHSGRRDLVIINRSFWPSYPVIGEALLRLAEGLADTCRVSVILQDRDDIRRQLAEKHRGKGVEFFPGKGWSDSSSRVYIRALDAVFFMCWVVFCLLRARPKTVYVSTDPPVLVPFVVMIYARIFRARYVYHLQDIHPEAANIAVRVHPQIYRLLFWMDRITMRRASVLITITDEMAEEIRHRSGTRAPIHILCNPAVSFDGVVPVEEKIRGFSFCGNAGRLQRIPLLLDAIRKYLDAGGAMQFAFAGGGYFSPRLSDLANQYEQVTYLGVVSAKEAAQLNCDYEWALLPIVDEVTRFAFPSKSSSYVFSGAAVLAVCGEQTSVAQWVEKYGLGKVVKPQVDALAEAFWQIEKEDAPASSYTEDRSTLMDELRFERFVQRLKDIVPLQAGS
ncbi:glycosyltransferase [Marinobacter zhanjiangensis]|nr:glycosyltransferase [Marinobacter zhanjiangensis]